MGNRVHWHMAYSLIGEDGPMVDSLSYHFRRTEKISRITEFERDLELTKGAHNRALISALRREGREGVAAALEREELHRGERARAPESPQEQAQRGRVGNPSPREIGEACLAAWRESGTAVELRANLARRGLELRERKKGPVVIDKAGSVRSLSRRLGETLKRIEGERIRAGEVRKFPTRERLQNAADGRQRFSEPRTGTEWVGTFGETKALRGGLASLTHALRVKEISMRWDAPRKRWLLSRGRDAPPWPSGHGGREPAGRGSARDAPDRRNAPRPGPGTNRKARGRRGSGGADRGAAAGEDGDRVAWSPIGLAGRRRRRGALRACRHDLRAGARLAWPSAGPRLQAGRGAAARRSGAGA